MIIQANENYFESYLLKYLNPDLDVRFTDKIEKVETEDTVVYFNLPLRSDFVETEYNEKDLLICPYGNYPLHMTYLGENGSLIRQLKSVFFDIVEGDDYISVVDEYLKFSSSKDILAIGNFLRNISKDLLNRKCVSLKELINEEVHTVKLTNKILSNYLTKVVKDSKVTKIDALDCYLVVCHANDYFTEIFSTLLLTKPDDNVIVCIISGTATNNDFVRVASRGADLSDFIPLFEGEYRGNSGSFFIPSTTYSMQDNIKKFVEHTLGGNNG